MLLLDVIIFFTMFYVVMRECRKISVGIKMFLRR